MGRVLTSPWGQRLSPSFDAAVQASHKRFTQVSVYRAGRMIVEDLPFNDGELTMDGEQNIPGEVTLTVPAGAAREWVPVDPLDPLAPFGQELRIRTGIEYQGSGFDPRYTYPGYGNVEVAQMGWFNIWSCDPDPLTGELKVTAYSQEKLLEESVLAQSYAPIQVGSSYMIEVRRFMQAMLSLGLSMFITLPPEVTNRPIPLNLVFEGSRLAILEQITAAWPARFRVDRYGFLEILAPVDKLARTVGPVLRTGERGVVAKWDAPNSRDELYNAVFVRGEDEDAAGRTVVGIATDNNPSSPTYWHGPFGMRPLEYSSPLITTNAQAAATARAMLARRLRRTRTVSVELVPDPRIDLDDFVQLETTDISGVGRVSAFKLPLRPDGGTMSLTLDDFEVAP